MNIKLLQYIGIIYWMSWRSMSNPALLARPVNPSEKKCIRRKTKYMTIALLALITVPFV